MFLLQLSKQAKKRNYLHFIISLIKAVYQWPAVKLIAEEQEELMAE